MGRELIFITHKNPIKYYNKLGGGRIWICQSIKNMSLWIPCILKLQIITDSHESVDTFWDRPLHKPIDHIKVSIILGILMFFLNLTFVTGF